MSYGNHGCNGGNMYNAFKYIVSNDGIDSENSYPYREYVSALHANTSWCMANYNHFLSQQTSCTYNRNYRAATASGLISISKGSEDELLSAVATVGPVSVGVDANSKAFMVSSLALCNVTNACCCSAVLQQWSVRLFNLF